jgi:hypothetical protein
MNKLGDFYKRQVLKLMCIFIDCSGNMPLLKEL